MDRDEFLSQYADGERYFPGIDLSGTNLSGTNLSGINLSGAYLNLAILREADLSKADLRGVILTGAYLKGADLGEANLSEANLNFANLSEANLNLAILSAAILSGANLSEANLNFANLSEANLNFANLSEANLNLAILSGANLSAAILSGANLRGANLSRAYLDLADLSAANLSAANLSAADLSAANLSEANLSAADLSAANLSGANLSGANLSGARLTEVKNLKTANLRNTNFAQSEGFDLNSLLVEENKISPNQEAVENLNELDKLCQSIQEIINDQALVFDLTKDDFNKLIKMAFLATFKKEESRYPKFQIYVPLKTEKPAHKLIVKFDEPIKINLNKISPLSRMGIGIPQKVGALVVEGSIPPWQIYFFCLTMESGSYSLMRYVSSKVGCYQGKNSHLQITGIVQINNHDELFGELLESKTNLVGIFIIIENPGNIHILFNLPNGSKIQLELTGGEVKINADAVQNALVNICFFEIATKIIKSEIGSNIAVHDLARYILKAPSLGKEYLGVPHNKSEEFNKFFELTKIIQRVWRRILKLVVNRNRGGQFVIVSSNMQEGEYPNLNISYPNQPNRDENYRNPIIDFFEKYYKYRTSYESKQTSFGGGLFNEHDLLESYHNLIQYIDLIANLSTIDGNIVFDQYLNLIGFGGEVTGINDTDSEKFKYSEYTGKTNFNTPLINKNIPNDINKLSGRQELIKLLLGADYLELFDKNHDANKWESKEYGTRHRSAARICTVPELNAFVFVVSQTGAVREFMHLAKNKVLVLGPLTPL